MMIEVEYQPVIPGIIDSAEIFPSQFFESLEKSKYLSGITINPDRVLIKSFSNSSLVEKPSYIKGKLEALLIYLEGNLDIEGRDKLSVFLKETSRKLSCESSVVMIMPVFNSNNHNKDVFKSIFWEAGYSSPRITNSKLPEGYCLIEAKKAKERNYIELTDKENKYYELIRGMWGKMAKGYRKNGWEVLNASESALLKHLKHTQYPSYAMQALRSGFGLQVKGKCGCVYDVGILGQLKNTKKCVEEYCLGEPVCSYEDSSSSRSKWVYKETIPIDDKNVYRLREPEEIDEKCFCGANLVQTWSDVKRLPKGRVLVIRDTYCPHDGHTPEIDMLFPEIKLRVPVKNII